MKQSWILFIGLGLSSSIHADTAPTTLPNQTQIPTVEASPKPTTPIINCEYHIPDTTTTIDNNIVTQWAEHALIQAFDFDPKTMDAQITKLKTCFTDQGWLGYIDALQKSGNDKAIKAQNFVVSSQVDGKIIFNHPKDNQWNITLPLEVVYQNPQEKLTQSLLVDLLIERKINGDLGIAQLVAKPKVAQKP